MGPNIQFLTHPRALVFTRWKETWLAGSHCPLSHDEIDRQDQSLALCLVCWQFFPFFPLFVSQIFHLCIFTSTGILELEERLKIVCQQRFCGELYPWLQGQVSSKGVLTFTSMEYLESFRVVVQWFKKIFEVVRYTLKHEFESRKGNLHVWLE
jgi:hypothetical protein